MKRQPLIVALPFRYRFVTSLLAKKPGQVTKVTKCVRRRISLPFRYLMPNFQGNEMRFYFVTVSLLPLSGNVGRSHP
jgi:hypothetical protein